MTSFLKLASFAAMATSLLPGNLQAAPLTGHNVYIEVSLDGGSPFLTVNTSVSDSTFEVSSAEDPFFDLADYIDIGADFIRVESDGIGPGAGQTVDIEIGFLDGASFIGSTTNTTTFPGLSTFAGQVLSSVVLISDMPWGEGGYFLIEGLGADFAASVPAPGALLLLGIGFAWAGTRRARAVS